MDKNNGMNALTKLIIAASLCAIFVIVFHNYWYQDNSYYIIRGNRIIGTTEVFSFGNPEMGWVPLKNGLNDGQKSIFSGLYNKSEEDRQLFKKLLEKLNELDKKLDKDKK
jgi:hypothetical protein